MGSTWDCLHNSPEKASHGEQSFIFAEEKWHNTMLLIDYNANTFSTDLTVTTRLQFVTLKSIWEEIRDCLSRILMQKILLRSESHYFPVSLIHCLYIPVPHRPPLRSNSSPFLRLALTSCNGRILNKSGPAHPLPASLHLARNAKPKLTIWTLAWRIAYDWFVWTMVPRESQDRSWLLIQSRLGVHQKGGVDVIFSKESLGKLCYSLPLIFINRYYMFTRIGLSFESSTLLSRFSTHLRL